MNCGRNTFEELQQRDSVESQKQPRMSSGPPSQRGGGSRGALFWVAVVCAQACGLACVGVVFYWMKLYGGFQWLDKDLQFNYHPVFMVLGLVYLYGDALIVYRVLSFLPKWILKVVHASLHVGAIALSSVALVAVLENHRRTEKADFYSLHSWLGIGTFGMFCLQYVSSFITFMWPGLPISLRSRIMPLHTFFGVAIFVMAIASALMGITEKLLWTPKYTSGEMVTEGIAGNSLGLLLIAFAFFIVFLTTRPSYKRKPRPEELPKTGVN